MSISFELQRNIRNKKMWGSWLVMPTTDWWEMEDQQFHKLKSTLQHVFITWPWCWSCVQGGCKRCCSNQVLYILIFSRRVQAYMNSHWSRIYFLKSRPKNIYFTAESESYQSLPFHLEAKILDLIITAGLILENCCGWQGRNAIISRQRAPPNITKLH